MQKYDHTGADENDDVVVDDDDDDDGIGDGYASMIMMTDDVGLCSLKPDSGHRFGVQAINPRWPGPQATVDRPFVHLRCLR